MKTMVPFSEMRKTVREEEIRLVGRKKSRVLLSHVHFNISNRLLHRSTNIIQARFLSLSPSQRSISSEVLFHVQT